MKPKNKKIKLKRIKELLENGETKLILPKQNLKENSLLLMNL